MSISMGVKGVTGSDFVDHRPRLEDVAARVGVSSASASLVLRGVPGPSAETRERVLAAAAELGYRVDRAASLLARRRRHQLGVMLDVRNAFHAELVEEIHVEADQAGYEVVLSTLTRGRDEQRAVETLLDFRCEALILLGPDSPASFLDKLAAQVPCVAVGRMVRDAAVDVVRSADDVGVDAALSHLIGLGHTRIAFVDGGRGAVAARRVTSTAPSPENRLEPKLLNRLSTAISGWVKRKTTTRSSTVDRPRVNAKPFTSPMASQ